MNSRNAASNASIRTRLRFQPNHSLGALAAVASLAMSGGCASKAWSNDVRAEVASADTTRSLLRALSTRTHAPSLSIAIMRDNQLVHSSGIARNGGEAGPETRYRIGSLSKLLTAAAVARLVEKGSINLDADVRTYVPEFPTKRYVVTLRQLGGHVGGIRHYGRREFFNTTHYDSVAPTIRIFASDSLLFEPGTRYFYSTFGYNLLGLALERAAHSPYLKVIQAEVTEPLGLRSMVPDVAGRPIEHRAPLFDLDTAGVATPSPVDDLSDRYPAGGFLANVADLARFGNAFVQPRFLADSTIRIMTTPQRLRTGASTGVGLGWRIAQDSAGRTIWHHAGSSNGGRSLLVIWPDEKLVVAIAANAPIELSQATAFSFADAIRANRERQFQNR